MRGKPCSICMRPRRLEIDDELSNPSANVKKIAEKYQVSYWALIRHRKNHLEKNIAEARASYLQEAKERTTEKFKNTIEYYDWLIKTFFANEDEVRKQLTLKDIIRVLEDRSELLDEKKTPARIEIRWGAGLDKIKRDNQEKVTITVPIGGTEEIKKEVEEEDEESI